MQTAPQINEPLLSDDDIQALMENAGALLLDPRIEPLARKLKQTIDHYAVSPLTLPVALAMLAASNGLARSIPTLDMDIPTIQAKVAELMAERVAATLPTRTLH